MKTPLSLIKAATAHEFEQIGEFRISTARTVANSYK